MLPTLQLGSADCKCFFRRLIYGFWGAKVTVPTDPVQLDEHNQKVTKARRTILSFVKDLKIPHIREKMTVKDMYDALITLYQSVNIYHNVPRKKKLIATHMSHTDMVASYLMRINRFKDSVSLSG